MTNYVRKPVMILLVLWSTICNYRIWPKAFKAYINQVILSIGSPMSYLFNNLKMLALNEIVQKRAIEGIEDLLQKTEHLFETKILINKTEKQRNTQKMKQTLRCFIMTSCCFKGEIKIKEIFNNCFDLKFRNTLISYSDKHFYCVNRNKRHY